MTKLVVLLALGGLFCYLLLPGLIESQLAGRLQTAFGAPTKPDVEVSSNNVTADLRGAEVSVSSLLEGSPSIETRSCTLNVEAPAVYIRDNQQCLGYLGLAGG